ncbi:hypothetical protein F383_22626 [Gossypium arboreum]|uniref:Uncharacterized protein n=1 Tax=Gossypium arboreum TaxID=29729 RepID=A0A0B0NSP7_GOSAR|nr:hypothetical protein F383_22626 [Gossypium arboreum]
MFWEGCTLGSLAYCVSSCQAQETNWRGTRY